MLINLAGIEESQQMVKFIDGLRSEIRLELQIQQPRNFQNAVNLAALIEKKLVATEVPKVNTAGANKPCFRCGKNGHMQKDCTVATKKLNALNVKKMDILNVIVLRRMLVELHALIVEKKDIRSLIVRY